MDKESNHANLFLNNNKKYICLLSADGNGYHYNKINKLWQLIEKSYFIKMVSDFLTDKIKGCITEINSTYCKHIWNMVKDKFVDNEFQDKINSVPNLLPLQNKRVINLKTLEIRSRKREDYFDFELQFEFLNTNLDNAKKYFSQLMNYDNEKINKLQKILGYCLTGETNLEQMYIFKGPGSNGKSELCNILKIILGKLCMKGNSSIIVEKGNNYHMTCVAPFVTSRLIFMSEISPENNKLNGEMIKMLLSDELLYENQRKVKMHAKYILETNYSLNIDTNDLGLQRRLVTIPFTEKFVNDPNNNFLDKIKTEHINEIFTWLCIGARKYYDENLMNSIAVSN